MRIAHLADVHLGLRLYGVERDGMNLKERDMLEAFQKAILDIIPQQPDVVIIAGDLFDTPNGPRTSIRPCITLLKQLLSALPDTHLILVGGNHDSMKTPGDSAHILLLIREALPQVRVRVYTPGTARLVVGDKTVHLGLLPTHYSTSAYAEPVDEPILRADPAADYNILVVHGMYPGLIIPETGKEDPLWRVDPSHYVREEWDYIAWGHYHEFTRLGPNEYYSGSLEHHSFPSPRAHPRGYLMVTLDHGLKVEHRPIPGRKHLEFDVRSLQELESLPLEPGAFVRLRVHDLDPEDYRQVVKAARQLQAICPVVRTELVRRQRPITVSTPGAGVGTVSLEERWMQFCRERVGDLPDGIGMDEVIERGLQALMVVQDKEVQG